jgi:phosphatidylinositol-3-phosphatase
MGTAQESSMINWTAGRVLGLTGLAAAAAMVVATGATSIPADAAFAQGSVPRFKHVVVVVMENKNYDAIIGRSDEAPYINHLADTGAVFSNSFGITHPSQPNYLALFSGSTQGVTNDNCPQNFTNIRNLGAELIRAKLSFTGYAESMPSQGYKGCGSELSLGYTRAHNPWADFSNVPAASNLPFKKFPTNFTQLPTVSFVIPNLCHDMHSCSRDSGDSWIKNNLGSYAKWATGHNSLLILTWDEDGTILGLGGDNNKIPTIFYGAHVQQGTYGEHTTHYNVLRTIEDMFGVSHAGASSKASPITDVWK